MIGIFKFTLDFLIILHAAFFCGPIVYYLGFLAAISNTQIVQWMWFCSLTASFIGRSNPGWNLGSIN